MHKSSVLTFSFCSDHEVEEKDNEEEYDKFPGAGIEIRMPVNHFSDQQRINHDLRQQYQRFPNNITPCRIEVAIMMLVKDILINGL